MPSKYTSQGKKIQEELDALFDNIKTIGRAQLYMHMLRKIGANKESVDKILQLYADAEEITVTNEEIFLKKP